MRTQAWSEYNAELQVASKVNNNIYSCLVWQREDHQAESPEAPDEVRRRDMIFTDPVHIVNIMPFIRDHLQQAIAACGGQDRFRDEWLVNVDKDVIEAFGKLGIM